MLHPAKETEESEQQLGELWQSEEESELERLQFLIEFTNQEERVVVQDVIDGEYLEVSDIVKTDTGLSFSFFEVSSQMEGKISLKKVTNTQLACVYHLTRFPGITPVSPD